MGVSAPKNKIYPLPLLLAPVTSSSDDPSIFQSKPTPRPPARTPPLFPELPNRKEQNTRNAHQAVIAASSCVSNSRKVLDGAGADGVGGILFFFFCFSSLFCFFVFCLRLSSFSPRCPMTRANRWNVLKNGGFHSDPVCSDPARNFPNQVCVRGLSQVMGVSSSPLCVLTISMSFSESCTVAMWVSMASLRLVSSSQLEALCTGA